jgi:hypothetical protein
LIHRIKDDTIRRMASNGLHFSLAHDFSLGSSGRCEFRHDNEWIAGTLQDTSYILEVSGRKA